MQTHTHQKIVYCFSLAKPILELCSSTFSVTKNLDLYLSCVLCIMGISRGTPEL
uniref:Uncharacterized protein n=1 Tax=Anguilla anguilla TaxID=7936 RepID=A0A0E9VGH1_ANGAN